MKILEIDKPLDVGSEISILDKIINHKIVNYQYVEFVKQEPKLKTFSTNQKFLLYSIWKEKRKNKNKNQSYHIQLQEYDYFCELIDRGYIYYTGVFVLGYIMLNNLIINVDTKILKSCEDLILKNFYLSETYFQNN